MYLFKRYFTSLKIYIPIKKLSEDKAFLLFLFLRFKMININETEENSFNIKLQKSLQG